MTLYTLLERALDEAIKLRDEAGRGEKGRKLAILATDLEKALAWAGYALAGEAVTEDATASETGVTVLNKIREEHISPTCDPGA